MICLSGFELYSRWVPLNYNILRVVKILNPCFNRFSKPVREHSVL